MNTISSPLTDRAAVLANKQGTLTEHQRDLLNLTSALTFWFALGSAAAIAGIVAWAMTKQMAGLPANAPHIPAYFWIVLAIAAGAPLLYLGWRALRSSRIRRELESGTISFEEGRIEWTGRQYRAAASVMGLSSIHGPLNEMPGRYRFYFLPGSRCLLSAEPLDTPQTSRAALTEILGKVLGFTKDDLAANGKGSITPTQAARFRSLSILTLIRHSIGRLGESGNTVASVQGTCRKTFRYMTRAVIRSCVVNGVRFDVGVLAYNAMVEGETYRVYYTPPTKMILSIEAIPPNSPPAS